MSKKLRIRNTQKKGRGVFATAPIKKGEIVEICPVIILPYKDRKKVDKTKVLDYYFYWGPKNQPAIALGYGSLYNHSFNPNIEYEQHLKKKTITFTALRNIKKGEELVSNYNGDPDSKDELWFKAK
jgi:SET domain-containing protein